MRKFYQQMLIALLAMIPVGAWAQTTFTQGDFTYTVTDEVNHKVSIAKADEATLTGALVIPSSVTYESVIYAVTSIADNAFASTGITSITIPASVQSVGQSAFYDCDALTAITIDDSETALAWASGYYNPLLEVHANYTLYLGRDLTTTENLCYFPGATTVEIGDQVTTVNPSLFDGASKLASVTMGSGVTSIGAYAFQNSGTDESVTAQSIALGANVTTIGDNAFVGCAKLATLDLGNKLEAIPSSMLNGCKALTSITIPASVQSVGESAFYDCDALTAITIDDSETALAWASGYNHPLYEVDANYTLYLGRDLTTEENYCYFPGATSVTFGDHVTTISNLNFSENSGVTAVYVPWLTAPMALADGDFSATTFANATLWVPGGTKDIYQAADGWKQFENIDFSSFVVTITGSAHGTLAVAGLTATNGETQTTLIDRETEVVFTATADEGYELTTFTVNGEAATTTDGSYTISSLLADQTVVAAFTPITYAITYDLAGGTVATANPATYNVESAAITLVNPTREGYTFAGWTGTGLDAAATTVTIPAGSTGDRTYTATWTPIIYNVSYDLAGGSVAEANAATYTIESAAIALTAPTRTGYTFKGWTGTGLDAAALEVTIPAGSTGNRTYTATWQINQYTITFNSNGGSTVPSITQDFATAVTAPADPTREGYTFTGWNQDVPTTIPAENVTLTAQWTINQYTITFNTNGGTTIDPIKQDYNSAVTAPANPTREGYTFAGWDNEIPTVIPAENVTITASWTPITYTLSYDLAEGSLETANPTSYNIESAAITLNNPTKEHFDFAGWTGTGLDAATKTVVIATGSTGNRSYTATWTKKKYTVVISGDNVIADNLNPEYGDNVVLTILADEDAELLKLTVDGTDVTASVSAGKYTITNVTANVEVVATWNKTKEYIHMAHSQATFSCTQDLDFTTVEGLKVYVASGFNKSTGKVLMTQIEGTVPAGTGLFLEGEEGVTYKVPYTTSCDAYYVSLLKPIATAQVVPTTDGAYTNFLYGEKEGVKGFYKSSGSGTVAAGKAYLQLPSSAVADIKGVGFEFDDETAISSVKADVVAPEGVYDIKGRKIPAGQKLTRGIYVINGKKVSIK